MDSACNMATILRADSRYTVRNSALVWCATGAVLADLNKNSRVCTWQRPVADVWPARVIISLCLQGSLYLQVASADTCKIPN